MDRDLPAIRKDTLRIAVVRDPLVYEERPGAITGLEYELLERFAAFVELPLAVVVAPSPDSLLPIVQRGEADIAAGLLNPHGAYEGKLSFSRAYRHTAPVL
ncbi:MAG: transporter substrate-binding domain-containing protein, partial [Flavobacteriales bacterium]|nr:transporter substrate-binding domain-containing protein [Flavobacteriales bacterium]